MKPQLELTFDQINANRQRPTSRRQRSLRRAQWWFDQMRAVVDRALDRKPAQGRPEQIYFSLSQLSQTSVSQN